MRALAQFLLVGTAAGVLMAFSGTALAQPHLGNTTWSSPSDTGCDIDISFNPDGTATVSETQRGLTHRDSAHWTFEGSEFHLTYDTWQGGIDGVFWQGGVQLGQTVESIQAVETYQDAVSGAERTRSCIFRKDK